MSQPHLVCLHCGESAEKCICTDRAARIDAAFYTLMELAMSLPDGAALIQEAIDKANAESNT